ncbi:hypothetical protein Are01nite_13910 [Actinoplanes regularis]|nr:hypothetical protein Are01nite_13910 [Actinoplanes regularis]
MELANWTATSVPITVCDQFTPDDHGESQVPKIYRRQPLAGRADLVHAEPCPGPVDATTEIQQADKASGGRDGGPILGPYRAAREPAAQPVGPRGEATTVAGQAFPPEPDS